MGIYFIIKDPLKYVVLFGLTASGNDAFGIASFLKSGFGYFQLIMQFLLILSALTALYYSRFKIQKRYGFIYLLSLLTVVWIILTVLQKDGIFYFGGICSWLANMSPLFLLIFIPICSDDPERVIRYFFIYIAIHVVFAFLTIYSPIVGVNIFESIEAIRYQDSPSVLANKNIALFSNFINLFGDKYFFNQSGYFHNSNDTGFFGAVGAFCGFYCLKKGKSKPLCISISFMGIALWFNSGMKGPVLGIIAGIILTVFAKKTKNSRGAVLKLACLLIVSVLLIPTISAVIDSLISSQSYNSRLIRRTAGIQFIANNPLWGNMASFDGLLENYIDPHELPLRMMVLFGVVSGVFIIGLAYWIPIKKLLSSMSSNFFTTCLIMVLMGVSLTNNYTDIVLFYFIYAATVLQPEAVWDKLSMDSESKAN